MKVTVNHPRPDVNRIVLDGRLDVAGAQAAEAEFKAALATGLNVIVDLAKVPFIASLGIRLLVAGAQERSKAGGQMVLMGSDELSKRILKTTGIDQLVPVCDTLDEALAKF